MKTPFSILLALAATLCLLSAQDRSADLEARLKESAESSPSAGRMMLELIDLYEEDEHLFGLIRTTGKFSRAQTDHPKRPEVMLKLIEGYAITGRHDDVLTTGRQFIEKFPNHGLAVPVRDHLATSLERTSRHLQAAKERDTNWRQGGKVRDGVRALQLYQGAANAEAFRLSTALAKAMVDKLPADTILTSAGLVGLEMAGRAELWAEGLQIGKAILRRNTPLTAPEKRRLWAYTGTYESRLGQHENAIISYRKALRNGDHAAHRSLISAMHSAKKPPAEIETAVRNYMAEYPGQADRYDQLAQVAHAYANANDLAGALKIGAEVMAVDAYNQDIPKAYVGWCGDNHARAERGLLATIPKNPKQAGKLRAVLALDLYRDRMKNMGKARAMAKEYLSKSPTEDGYADYTIGLLLGSSADDKAFQQDVALVVQSARTHLHLQGYQDRVWRFSIQDKNRNRVWQQARKEFGNQQDTRSWKQVWENGGKSGQACQHLLQQKQTPEVKRLLMSRLAYNYLHHFGGTSRKKAAEHYQALCKAFPKDYQAAQKWLEAASYSDQIKEMRIAATKHVLTFTPQPTHYDTWYRLIETRDPDLIRKALPWITKATALSSNSLYHTTRLGDIMWELEMKSEAVAWWRSRIEIDPNHGECVNCVHRVAKALEPEKARVLLQKHFAADTDYQGSYAGALSHLAFQAGDLGQVETVLKQSKDRAHKKPFVPWRLEEWPTRGWLDAARGSKEWSASKKAQIYRIVRSLELPRVSTEAALELLANEAKGLKRLRATHRAILFSDQHHDSWKRIFPYAQGAIAREDYQLGATILNGLLNTIRGVAKKETDDARTLLRKAYGKMGSLSAEIPEDSPIAPLLQIILHLRLGEEDLAEGAYYKNQTLFDENRANLPIELILFGAETHINQGAEEDHQRAEDLLRGWMIKNGESESVEIRDKARVQLLLARNYQHSQQFDIARAEFTTVLNTYKDQPEAVEARFGIGETFMAQKVYDQAEEIFLALSESPDPQINIRAEFLRGVLEIRQENNESARKIFLAVLERAPDAELANKTLFNLAEVYGIEQRYLTQLETLRTVGRLGRESKLWHTPGKALSVVVQDIDLGISRGETRIPVVIRTEPGGDEEKSFLVSGGAGKGIFLTEIATALGVAEVANGTLEVTGGDVITVDYPAAFKKEFQFEFLSATLLRVASDGSLEVASGEILDEEEGTFTDTLKQEAAEELEHQGKAHQRPSNQIKPGNLIYVQVKDGDRDLTKNPDGVPIMIRASSGDQVQTTIQEESQHGGVFSGTIRTGELPAGAQASDSALDHNALMAIDHSKDTYWRSEPDGAAPKSLAIDLKELREVDSIAFQSPDPEKEAPVRMHVRGSHDGRFWYTLAHFPTPEPDQKISFGEDGMTLRIFQIEQSNLRDRYPWKDIVDLVENVKPTKETKVESLSWTPPEEGKEAYFLVWSGTFFQERAGGMRFTVNGQLTGMMVDGRLELPMGEGGRQADIFAKAGAHELTVVSIVSSGGEAATASRARENPQSASVALRSFKAEDFDLSRAADFPKIEGALQGELVQDKNQWTLTLPRHEMRFIECEILEYRGEAVAINHVEVKGAGITHVPPKQDVLLLAKNQILELAPGDTVEISYLDEITAGGEQRNKLLTAQLTATYYNGQITPISYDFDRSGDGSVRGARKELLRIEPGERIVAEVVDYDLDIENSKDRVEVQVQVNADPPRTLTAIETGPSTGVFTIEIDTAAAAQAEEGKLVVKQGDKVYIRYKDEQNTFPGHAFYREAVILLNEPTEGVVQIVESRQQVEGALTFVPAEGERTADFVSKIDYHLPLTVEVIDPDQAKDSRSTVTVEVVTTQGTKVQVECVLSRSFAPQGAEMEEVRNPALQEGRFVGQIPLLLGGIDSAIFVPADGTVKKPGIGRVLPPPVKEEDLLEDGEAKLGGLLVLNVNGRDQFTAHYQDERRPAGEGTTRQAKAELASAASLRLTDEEYQEDALIAHVGKKVYLWLEDPDLDLTPGRDKAMIRVKTMSGEDETLELEETLSHSGVFSGSFPLKAAVQPVRGNSKGEVECFFGDLLTAGYLDNVIQTPEGDPIIELALPIAVGTNGVMSAFSKVYKDEDLAIQTQFHIAESYFELFKSHLKIERDDEAQADLAAGRRVLREVQEDHPNPKYAPRVAYLLGQFAQEMKEWDEAIASYKSIVRGHPEHELAPDSQYKLGQCYEQAGQLDEALESYVTLAATYPKSPLIANVMLRINEHFYGKEDYAVAASVGSKFLERFPNHEWTPKMGFRIGQCYYKEESFENAGDAFDTFVKRFPEEELTAQALFWAGESYRMDNDVPNAFRRYNRCRWDFPESDAAKYSRGRLALPEMLAQFEREANLSDE
ncbi:MAG: tetratricopeptide repeat protein [Roseibacillus sp.]|nr:tetratricopeptide repeat protein [Roseibacillus sp.]